MAIPLLDNDVLRTFVAISECGTFTDAAKVVHRTPSALSMQIKQLELTLGKCLFIREPRQVRLTAEGEALLDYSRRLLRLNEEAVRYFLSPTLEGKVGIGTSDDVGTRILPEVLAQFARSYPAVQVNVVVGSSKQNLALLDAGELDMALDSAGKPYRIAYTCEHCSGQEAAMVADLAVAPFPKSLVHPPLKEIANQGLPEIGSYQLALVRRGSNQLNDALALHVKGAFRSQRFY